MGEFLNRRRSKATLWTVTGNDISGDQQYAAPVSILVRWEERKVVFTNSSGQDEMSSAVVWLDRDVNEGDAIVLGTSTAADPWTVSGAREIQGFIKVPHVLRDDYERRAFLGARRLR